MLTTEDTFAHTLWRMRTRNGISQSRLAAACMCDHSFINRLEAGNRKPSRDMVRRLARELNLDSADEQELYLSAGYAPPGVTVTDPLALKVQSLMQSPDTSDGYRMMAVQVISALVQGANGRA